MRMQTSDRVRCVARRDGLVSLVSLDQVCTGYIYPQETFDAMDFYPTIGMEFVIILDSPEPHNSPTPEVVEQANINGWGPRVHLASTPVGVST